MLTSTLRRGKFEFRQLENPYLHPRKPILPPSTTYQNPQLNTTHHHLHHFNRKKPDVPPLPHYPPPPNTPTPCLHHPPPNPTRLPPPPPQTPLHLHATGHAERRQQLHAPHHIPGPCLQKQQRHAQYDVMEPVEPEAAQCRGG